VRVAVVDDEELARQRLERLLRAHADVELVATLGDAEAAVRELPARTPDLVLLDIRMPQRDGLDVASALASTTAEIVFVTAYDEFAVRAFAAGALDYLQKPVDAAQLARALDRVRARARAARPPLLERLAVRDGGRFIFVSIAELDAVIAAGNYVELRVAGRGYQLRATLASLEARLDPAAFVRLHRSALVRVERIKAVEPLFKGEYLVTLADGTTLTSSRTQRAALRAALGLP
jgi:two-component system, LytTR family, response regulator